MASGKRKKMGAVIRMGASSFSLSFDNGDCYNLNTMSRKDFNATVEFIKAAFNGA